MAELLAIGQDLKNLGTVTSINSDGSANIKLTGNTKYHPELRLTKSDKENILKILSPLPIEKPKEEKHEESSNKEEAKTNMLVGVDTGGWGGIFSELSSSGIKYVRTASQHGTLIAEAAAHGVIPLTVVFGEGGTIGSINPTSYANEFVSISKKYSLLAGEVLNEPGGSWFWSDPTNYSAYVNLLKYTHEAVKAAGLSTKILASWDGGVGGSTSFGANWSKLGGLNYCDEVTVHPYGGDNGQYGGKLGDRNKIEKAHSESGKLVAVTEAGFPTAIGQPVTGDSQQWSETQQAENVSNLINFCREKEYVSRYVNFNFQDYGTNNFYGIRTISGKKKIAYGTLTFQAA